MHRLVFQHLCLIGLYFTTGLIGLEMASLPGMATPLFPPAGIAIGFLLLYGRSFLSSIFLSSLLLNLYSQTHYLDLSAFQLFVSSVGISLGVTFQAWVAFSFVNRFIGSRNPLNEELPVLKFLLLIGPIACATAASVSLLILASLSIIPQATWWDTWLNWWVGDSIGSMLFGPLVLAIGMERQSNWPRVRKLSVVVPSLLLIITCTIIFHLSLKNHESRSQLEFERKSSSIAQAIRERMAVYETMLSQVEKMAIVSPYFSAADYKIFTSSFIRNYDGLEAITWMPKVDHADRPDFEAYASQQNSIDYQIKVIGPERSLTPSPKKEVYFPALYSESQVDSKRILGFDLNSQDDRHEALWKALRTRSPVATERLRLVYDDESVSAALIIYPVLTDSPLKPSFTDRDLLQTVRGFVAGVIRIQDLIKTAVADETQKGIRFVVWDASSESDDILFESFRGEKAFKFAKAQAIVDKDPHDPHAQVYTHEEVIRVADRDWKIRFVPCLEYLSRSAYDSIRIASLGLLFIVVALQGFLLVFTGRAGRIRKLVDEKTFELKESETRFKRLTENMPVMIWTTNPQMKCDYLNKRWFEYTKRSVDECLGMGWIDSVHPEDMNECYFKFASAHKKQEAFELQYRLQNEWGAYRWMLVKGTPRFNLDGTFVGFVGSAIDIHEAVSHRSKIERLNSELLQFKYRISHDIVSPLATAQGMLKLAEEDAKAGDYRSIPEYLKYLKESLQRQSRTIENVLAVARADAEDEESLEIDLRETLQRSFQSHSEVLKSFPIELKLELTVDRITTQRTRFEQVIENLISNAIKYRDAKKLEHFIKISSRLDRMGNLVIDFIDNGIGFDTQYSDDIFKKFTRRTSSHSSGTGLGLYIVKCHLERMGGMIFVIKSRNNTHFRLVLKDLSKAQMSPKLQSHSQS